MPAPGFAPTVFLQHLVPKHPVNVWLHPGWYSKWCCEVPVSVVPGQNSLPGTVLPLPPSSSEAPPLFQVD